ncbi:hypothetical protein Tco_0648366 [Tanacetum coccineum]
MKTFLANVTIDFGKAESEILVSTSSTKDNTISSPKLSKHPEHPALSSDHQTFELEEMGIRIPKEDLTLWKLVKDRFKTELPKSDLEKCLFWPLKVMFEPVATDLLWQFEASIKRASNQEVGIEIWLSEVNIEMLPIRRLLAGIPWPDLEGKGILVMIQDSDIGRLLCSEGSDEYAHSSVVRD